MTKKHKRSRDERDTEKDEASMAVNQNGGDVHEKSHKKQKRSSESVLRDNSISPDDKKKKHKKEKKEKSKKKKEEKRKRHHRSTSEDDQGPPASKLSKGNESGDVDSAAVPSSSGDAGGEVNLSIEESNALRAKLGLAPLRVGKQEKKQENLATGEIEKVVTVDGEQFVHKPAKSLTSEREAQTLREKLQAQREKRQILSKISEVKTLGEADEEDSAASWVERSRKKEEERQLALKRAQALEELDKDFAVGELIDKEIVHKHRRKENKAKEYSSKQLAGLTVEHSTSAFQEGKEVILVLKDKEVLAEDDDVLVNPNLIDEEQWKRNTELRKKKPGYNPYEEEEMDDFGMPKHKNLLGKYDEELEGRKKETFKIEPGGKVHLTREKELEMIRQKLKSQAESLQLPSLVLATEYLTPEEIAFKKPKKKVKVRRREVLRADDLKPLVEDVDYGSRQRGRGRKKEVYEDGQRTVEDMDVDMKLPTDLDLEGGVETWNPDDDLACVPIIDDEAEEQLQQSLHRARLVQQKTMKAEQGTGEDSLSGPSGLAAKRVAAIVQTLPKSEPVDDDDKMPAPLIAPSDAGGSIVLDSISEYCRGLGDIPTFGMAGNREETEMDELLDFEREALAKQRADEDSGDDEEMIGERAAAEASSDEETEMVPLLEEPDVGKGVANALKMAVQKGYLDLTGPRICGDTKLVHLHSQNYSVMDKQFQDIDDKYAKKLDRMGMGGPIVEFKEKRDYKPDIKIEYADEDGHLMNTKEAFQYQSWKFHGKRPGKKKMEKKIQKRTQHDLMQGMSSTDTPLGTLSLQQEKLKELQQPFIILSGAGAKDMGASLRKD